MFKFVCVRVLSIHFLFVYVPSRPCSISSMYFLCAPHFENALGNKQVTWTLAKIRSMFAEPVNLAICFRRVLQIEWEFPQIWLKQNKRSLGLTTCRSEAGSKACHSFHSLLVCTSHVLGSAVLGWKGLAVSTRSVHSVDCWSTKEIQGTHKPNCAQVHMILKNQDANRPREGTVAKVIGVFVLETFFGTFPCLDLTYTFNHVTKCHAKVIFLQLEEAT